MKNHIDASYAQLDWDDDGQPHCGRFGDVYFSRASGIEESRYVFLQQNQLHERWQELPPQSQFVIAETGFGTGLNFLCSWQLWQQLAPEQASLHYISTEKYPLLAADLQRALSLWPELANESQALLEKYPVPQKGVHRLSFCSGKIQLTLLIGDVNETLPELEGAVDAWFLDGFAPAKNPQMWQPELFEEIARHSHEATTLATFTAAGLVRRGLKNVGFKVEKVPGFGRKREMVRGQFESSSVAAHTVAPWFKPTPAYHADANNRAVVVGGGVAGASSARALAERGWQVTLLEQHGELAQEGSGNPQGILYMKLSAHNTPLTQLALAGFQFSKQKIRQLLPRTDPVTGALNWDDCGVIQLGFTAKEQKRQQQLIESGVIDADLVQPLSAEALSQKAGIEVPAPGLWFPSAGWLNPPALCKALADHPNITCHYGAKVESLQHDGSNWHIATTQGESWQSSITVIACGHQSRQLEPSQHLPVKAIRGQITNLPATSKSQALRTVICHEGYIAPARGLQHTLGATFNLKDDDTSLRLSDHQANLASLAEQVPALAAALAADHSELHAGRVGFRCTTPDYLPLIGPVAIADAFKKRFAALRKNAKTPFSELPDYYPGLYINTGHGSRGMITAPLCAELLAAQISGEPAPMPRRLIEALHPNRFLVRGLIRNEL